MDMKDIRPKGGGGALAIGISTNVKSFVSGILRVYLNDANFTLKLVSFSKILQMS